MLQVPFGLEGYYCLIKAPEWKNPWSWRVSQKMAFG